MHLEVVKTMSHYNLKVLLKCELFKDLKQIFCLVNIECCQMTHLCIFFDKVPDFFEDGLPPPAQAYLKVCSAVSEASLNDVKPSSPPSVLASPQQDKMSPSSGTTVQRRSVLHTEEIVRLAG